MGTQPIRLSLILLTSALMCACGRSAPAPVINAWLEPQAQSADYIVHKGDTLYSIAWQFGLDYYTLAQMNHLKPPYSVSSGQRLKMTTVARGTPQLLHAPIQSWQWPAQGKIIKKYSNTLLGNAGINIIGKVGTPIHAALSGEVVYSGNGMRGYGYLIIIRHGRHYLSAYAYNQRLLVRLGQWVNTGEAIATMGHDDTGQAMLHFEIRYDGQPVDPLLLLR